MPRKPKRPCAYQGCPKLTEGRFCDEHKRLEDKMYDRYKRPVEHRERYGYAWRKIRKAFLLKQPFCEMCAKEKRMTLATEVHHILPLAHGGKNDNENLMALCKSCHSRISVEMGDRFGRKN